MRSVRGIWLVGLGVAVAACSLDSSVPHRGSASSPVSSGVVASDAGAPDDDAPFEPVITDIGGSPTQLPAIEEDGGTDSGGAPDESAGGIGGAASSRGGAAAAGGRASTQGGASGAAGNGSAGMGGASNPPATLYFSEYVEGSSSYKALEIATRARSVLDGCKVAAYFNGKTEPTVIASLSGVLEVGQVLTVCSSSLQEKLHDVCRQVGNLTFNGDDALAIGCDGKILDVLGQLGADPGVAWGSGASSTLDHTLRRKCSVTSGTPSGSGTFNPSTEWQAFPVDTFSGLGARGC